MKYIGSIAFLFLLAACSSPRPTTVTTTSAHEAYSEPADSVVYYRTTFEADQKNYLPQMLGEWMIHTMQRQARLPEETLNMSFRLQDNRTFVANTSCGEMKGTFSVKGVSIRFHDVSYNRNNCTNTEQLDEMVRLLTKTVSMYTVNGNMFTLRDNSSNIIFRGTR